HWDRAALGDAAWSSARAGLEEGRIAVDEQRRTMTQRVWAGGDCVHGGKDLTVSAVEDGKRAARSIHAALISHAKS
ncbi:MAG: hypothetical protein ACLPSW_00445, partial [Roseiarcus sp.]